MKFLFVSANHGGGGSEELWVQTAGRLRSLGHLVMALSDWKAGAQRRVKQLEDMGVTHRSLCLPGKRAVFHKVLERLTGQKLWRDRFLSGTVGSLKPDLIVFNSGTLLDGIPLLEHVQAMRQPYVVVTHLVSTDNWPDDSLAVRIHRTYSSAMEACFVSEHNRELYVLQTGQRLANVCIVRNPFLVSGEAISMPVLNADTMVRLALPARLHPKTKGHDMLFEVLARPEWRERKIQVSLFGTGGCEKTLGTLSQELGICGKVVFAGHVDDMNEVWRQHHALILPSRHEGLPIAQIEAMLAGRAVIATPAGGIGEMMEHGRTGFLAAACDTNALNAVLDEAWGQRSHWGRLGEEGRRLVQARIPADPVTVWADHLLELARKKRGRL